MRGQQQEGFAELLEQNCHFGLPLQPPGWQEEQQQGLKESFRQKIHTGRSKKPRDYFFSLFIYNNRSLFSKLICSRVLHLFSWERWDDIFSQVIGKKKLKKNKPQTQRKNTETGYVQGQSSPVCLTVICPNSPAQGRDLNCAVCEWEIGNFWL